VVGYLDFWLKSIEEHAQNARIFLAATHCDKVKKNKKLLEWVSIQISSRYGNNESILASLVSNNKQELVFFPIDNRHSHKDVGVQQLRSRANRR